MNLTPASTDTRRIFPIDGDTETWVDIRDLADAESNRIYDRNKYMPGSKSANMTKATAVLHEVVQESVTDWGGFTLKNEPVPCTNENKLMLLETVVTGSDGERTTLWAAIMEKFSKLKEADAKN